MSKKKTKNNNDIVVIRWAILALLLVFVVFLLVSKYSVTNENTIRENIESDLGIEADLYSETLANHLHNAKNFAEGVAATISGIDNNANDSESLAKLVTFLPEDIYMLAVTDTFGKGILSTGEIVNLSASNYYYSKDASHFSYTDNNMIDERSAFVYVTPYYHDGEVCGNVTVFLDVDKVLSELPYKKYGSSGFAIITSDGRILCKAGSDSSFNGGEDFYTNIASASLQEISFDNIILKFEMGNSFVFPANIKAEKKTIVVSPVDAQDWKLVEIINTSYVDVMVKGGMRSTRNLVIALFITVGVFVGIIVLLYLKNRFQYGEESKSLSNKADTDLLTDVNNKISTERKIQEYMDENPDSQCVMFLFDIDNFKKINDTMGHAFGDQVLSSLGHQLKNEFRITDIIGRLGGDEFVVFLKNIKSDEQVQKEGVRIIKFFQQFKVGDYVKYSATASIGGVVVPKDANDFQTAYKAADKALYEAKRRGKNQLVFYSQDMQNVKSVRVSDSVEK